MKAFIEDIALWFVWVPLRFVIQHMSLKWAYKFANLSAYIFCFFAVNKKKIMTEELQRIFRHKSRKDINRIVKQSFSMYLKRQVENLIYGGLTKERLEEMVSVEGLENLNAALDKGSGVIILLSHLGSYLLVLPALAFRGYRINQLTGPPVLKGNRQIHQRIFQLRKEASNNLPVNFLRTDQSLRAAIRALKNNECIAVAFDGRAGKHWVPIRMFGLKAFASPGPVRIAMKTKAAIIPTFIVRQKNNTHRLILESPFELKQLADTEQMTSINTQRFAEIFEKYIQEFPSQYGMVLQIMRDRINRGIIDKALFHRSEECDKYSFE